MQEISPELLQVLEEKRALSMWEQLPPSHKKRYLDWINDAKREETRKKRIVKAVAMIQDGS